MPPATRAILDVDTGTDDALALALAVRSPALELVAVTTVAGNVGLTDTTENTVRVLGYLGAGHVPVHRGLGRPLARPLLDAGHVHGERGLGGLDLPPVVATGAYPSAPQFLVDALMARPGELTLVCTGPLTNLASAIALEPRLPAAMRRLVIMGGSLGPGNVTPHAEFNIWVDPEAAAQVFASCALTMAGLDVTHQTSLTPLLCGPLVGVDTDAARLVYGVTRHSFDVLASDTFHLHDPLAVGVAIDPTLCTTRRGTLRVDTSSSDRAGQTTLEPDSQGPHEACVGVDAARFLGLFAETLGLPPFLPI